MREQSVQTTHSNPENRVFTLTVMMKDERREENEYQ